MTTTRFIPGLKYFIRHRSARQKFDRISTLVFDRHGPTDDRGTLLVFKEKADDEEVALALHSRDVVSAKVVDRRSETYVSMRAMPEKPPPLPPPLPPRPRLPDGKQWLTKPDDTIHEAEIVEDEGPLLDETEEMPADELGSLLDETEAVPGMVLKPFVLSDDRVILHCKEILKGADAVLKSGFSQAREGARNIVLELIQEHVNTGRSYMLLDSIAQGIASLFDKGMSYAAVQMLYARWGIPEHRPDNGHVFTPWTPALESRYMSPTVEDRLL